LEILWRDIITIGNVSGRTNARGSLYRQNLKNEKSSNLSTKEGGENLVLAFREGSLFKRSEGKSKSYGNRKQL